MTTHYSCAQIPDVLQSRTNKLLKKLAPYFEHGDVPIFCYSGMSGVAMATAMSLNYKGRHGMIYVRKLPEIEHCHGKKVEYNFNSIRKNDRTIFVFVDDFIITGNTMRYTMDTIKKECVQVMKVRRDYNINESKMLVATIGTSSRADDTQVYPVDMGGYNKLWEDNL